MADALAAGRPFASALLPSVSLDADRIWTMPELDILHSLSKPVAILVSGAYEDPHSENGIRYMSRVVLQNQEAQRRFGQPRSAAAYSKALNSMTQEARTDRWNWLMSIYKGKKQTQSWLDVHALLRPVFDSVPSTPCITRLDSKPIRIQINPDLVETAIMHILEVDANTSEMRLAAMHQINPLHTFMFNSRGKLLNANAAAVAACDIPGSESAKRPTVTLQCLFERGNYPGGREEAEAAFDEAFNAVFSLQLERHRHIQPYISMNDGRNKWAMIEMSPMIDPMDGSPAVLVQRYNITQQKELELQLSLQQEALQRHNQELEQDALAMDQEKAKLQQEADSLAQRLEAVLNDKFEPRTSFDADTPIDKTLNFLQNIISGGMPKVQAALELYHILSESNTDLRQPVGLEMQLLKDEALDSEVGQSMLQLLQGGNAAVRPMRVLDDRSPKSSLDIDPSAAAAYISRPTLINQASLGATTPAGWSAEVAAASAAAHAASAAPAARSLSRLRSSSPAVDESTPSASSKDSRTSGQCSSSAPANGSCDSLVPATPSHSGSASAMLLAPVTPTVERMLHDAENNWAFDIFAFADATKGSSLSMLTFHLLRQTGLVSDMRLDELKLKNFLQKIEAGYDSTNPYHNSIHVASVVQMTHMLLCHGGVIKSGVLSRTAQMSTYWSACVHDFEHGGLNNDFLIKTSHPLAITYNDQSPLENHHHAAGVRLLLHDPSCRYLPADAISTIGMTEARSMTISQVLGTDMKKHFDITSRFQAAFKRPAAAEVTSQTTPEVNVDWDNVKLEDKTLVYQMVLKCADIGHLAAAPRTHRRWAFQLEEEFFRQGDKERSCGLLVSPLMDRTQQGGMTRSQLGFFSIVGIPLFKALVDLFPEAKPVLDGVTANFHHWEAATELADLPI